MSTDAPASRTLPAQGHWAAPDWERSVASWRLVTALVESGQPSLSRKSSGRIQRDTSKFGPAGAWLGPIERLSIQQTVDERTEWCRSMLPVRVVQEQPRARDRPVREDLDQASLG